ncbi:MAG: tRNA lysidine(34) synthetase TilS [Muribaculaceae bacterium]|nr:tRNA lysidine(34) synthetase TilS [Muribaculaceae bacterium]
MEYRHPFEQSVATFIDDKNLPKSPAKLIVALSGGADSVALAAVLTALGYECVAAHCNFRLRGEESTRDRDHAVDIARQLDMDIHVRDFDVPARMSATGESLEMACRALRYDWFNDLLESEHAIGIAVGHHREDSAETFILNLMRSSGINGLTGINPVNGLIIRPMLNTSRPEIEQYLHDRSLTWVDDSTNAESEFRRNAVRNRVFPLLDEIFGASTSSILKTADYLSQVKAVYDRTIAGITKNYFYNNQLFVARLMSDTNDETIAATYIYEILAQHGFTRDTADKIVRAVNNNSTGIKFSSTHNLEGILDHGVLTIRHPRVINPDANFEVSIYQAIHDPIDIDVIYHTGDEFTPHKLIPGACYLDSSVLTGNPTFTIRHRRTGDRIKPFGMGGRSKLVSDIMTEAHYTTRQKEDAWLLTRNDEVLWIIGLRTSINYPVTDLSVGYYVLIPQ